MVSYLEQSIDNNGGHLFCYKTGKGAEMLLLFHGFGQDHTAFNSLTDALSEIFTIYSFDLFFHGRSTWLQNEEPLEKSQWRIFISEFLQKNNIDKFSTGGFSLGGKFAMATAELFPTRVKKLFLFAPDGIRTNPWYSLATYPLLIRRLFKSMILKPQRFFSLVRMADRLRISDKALLRFVESQMDTIEKRQRVYFTWVVFRHLKFDMVEMGGLLDTHAIDTLIVTGRFDNVILSKNMRYLAEHSHKVILKELECGHNKLLNHSELPKSVKDFMFSV